MRVLSQSSPRKRLLLRCSLSFVVSTKMAVASTQSDFTKKSSRVQIIFYKNLLEESIKSKPSISLESFYHLMKKLLIQNHLCSFSFIKEKKCIHSVNMSNQYKFTYKTHKMSSVTANMKVGGNGFHQSSPALRSGSFSIFKKGK